ncbi:hypothetical protein [Actinoplanes sp. NPDC026670]|uniref:hypothetical protein n=1 Tax=Actinoplanes sp. NPDC026670 TaxID=3154700 RepID=UPI0033F78C78
MEDNSAVGTHVVVIPAARLDLAVERLLSLGTDALRHLKVKSGEPLAAILLTAFLGVPPLKIDEAGGVDFAFSINIDDQGKRIFSRWPSVAFEAKSLAGGFRRQFAQMEKLERDGGSSIGTETSVIIRTASDILTEGFPQIREAARQLDLKISEECSRNAFLIIHPFEHFAVETVSSHVMAPHLPAIPSDINLDSVWVLWFPDHLTMWSKERQEWIELIFTAFNPEDPDSDEYRDPDLTALQIASSRMLSVLTHRHGDPYNFSLTAGPRNDNP